MPKNTERDRDAARAYVLDVIESRGISPAALAHLAGVDPKTVRAFLFHGTWPHVTQRHKIEAALGEERGFLDVYTRSDEPGMSAPSATVAVVEHGAGEVSGRNVITVRAAAIGVEVQTTYADEAERSRFLEEVLGRLGLKGD